ncbi:Bug family tripartite tricarboxylate transporter substrate binding protein [Roseomonas sp. BN140053]|uniref:Bug family tripartite tricarboxylate transporter substrate binding protein n=1 Tax=Roseomonas sp. BN140053 TaxID=3391898 RepID=UPI0039E85D51
MRLTRRGVLAGLGGAPLVGAGGLPAARAQGTYPDRPVRIIVPFGGGGANDILGRLFGQKLAEKLGQPFVIENRPGAAGQVGTEAAIRARPDGYTLVVNPSGPILANPGSEQPAYDVAKDLAPVAVLATFPTFMMVAADSPIRTLGDLVSWAKARPANTGTFGFGGLSFRMLVAQLCQRAGIQMQDVVYRSSVEAINATANGETTLAVTEPGPALAGLEGKRVRALTVSTPTRYPLAPDVPTTAEAGFPGLEQLGWIGLFAPAGTPPAVLARLETVVAEAARTADVRDRLAPLGLSAEGGGGEALRRMAMADNALWPAIARESGISLVR